MQYPPFDWQRPAIEGMSIDDWVTALAKEVFRPSVLYVPIEYRGNQQLGPGDADVGIWARMSFWHAEEIAALGIGKNPTVLNRNNCSMFAPDYALAREFLAILAIVERAYEAGQLPLPCRPGFALAWMDRNVIGYPSGLRFAVAGIGHEIADWQAISEAYAEQVNAMEADLADLQDKLVAADVVSQSLGEELDDVLEQYQVVFAQQREMLELKQQRIAELAADQEVLAEKIAVLEAREKIDPRLKSSLEKIALGLAMDNLGYQPGEARSNAHSEIESILTQFGMRVSAETIRNILRDAAQAHYAPGSGAE